MCWKPRRARIRELFKNKTKQKSELHSWWLLWSYQGGEERRNSALEGTTKLRATYSHFDPTFPGLAIGQHQIRNDFLRESNHIFIATFF